MLQHAQKKIRRSLLGLSAVSISHRTFLPQATQRRFEWMFTIVYTKSHKRFLALFDDQKDTTDVISGIRLSPKLSCSQVWQVAFLTPSLVLRGSAPGNHWKLHRNGHEPNWREKTKARHEEGFLNPPNNYNVSKVPILQDTGSIDWTSGFFCPQMVISRASGTNPSLLAGCQQAWTFSTSWAVPVSRVQKHRLSFVLKLKVVPRSTVSVISGTAHEQVLWERKRRLTVWHNARFLLFCCFLLTPEKLEWVTKGKWQMLLSREICGGN